MDNSKLNFEYRSSMFKKKKGYYIVSAKIKLTKGDSSELLEKIAASEGMFWRKAE